MIGDFLYELSPRDSVSAGIELVTRTSSVVALLAALTSDFQVPFERIFRLEHARIAASPGLGQRVTIMNMVMILPDTGQQMVLAEPTISGQGVATQSLGIANLVSAGSGAVDDTLVIFHTRPVFVPGGAIIRANAAFDVAVNANTLNFSLNGFTLPRGNVVF